MKRKLKPMTDDGRVEGKLATLEPQDKCHTQREAEGEFAFLPPSLESKLSKRSAVASLLPGMLLEPPAPWGVPAAPTLPGGLTSSSFLTLLGCWSPLPPTLPACEAGPPWLPRWSGVFWPLDGAVFPGPAGAVGGLSISFLWELLQRFIREDVFPGNW